MEVFLKSIGLNRGLSLLAGFRGPRHPHLPSLIWALFTDLAGLWYNLVTVGINFFSPGLSLATRCLSGFPLMSLCMCGFRMVYFHLRRKDFDQLVKGYRESFKGDPYPEHLKEEMKKCAEWVRKMPIILILFLVVPMGPWCASPIIADFLGYPRTLSVPAYNPFDLNDDLSFVVEIVLQTMGSTFVPLKNVAFDHLFFALGYRQVAHLRHLRHNFGRLFDVVHTRRSGLVVYTDYDGRPTTPDKAFELLNCRLGQWVEHHRESIRLINQLQRIYSPFLLVQFSLQLLGMCTNAFVVAAAPLDILQLALCGCYVLGNALELLFTSRIGDFIAFESRELTAGSLNSGWPVCPRWLLASVKIVLTRCQVSHKISALGVFPLDTETFRAIMLSSYSYFTVLIKLKKTIE